MFINHTNAVEISPKALIRTTLGLAARVVATSDQTVIIWGFLDPRRIFAFYDHKENCVV